MAHLWVHQRRGAAPGSNTRRQLIRVGGTALVAGNVPRALAARPAPAVSAPAAASVPTDEYVETYRQRWALSCEYAATHTALRLLGLDVAEDVMRATLGSGEDPDEVFRGEIQANQTLENYGVHARGIAWMIDLLKAAGHLPSRFQSRLLYDLDAVRTTIAQGQPVVAWLPLQLRPSTRVPVQLSTGKTVHLVHAEHTVTLHGYEESQLFALDPYNGSTPTYEAAALLAGMRLFDDPALALGVAQDPSTPPAPTATPIPTSERFPETGLTLDGGFYQLFRRLGGRAALGVPLTPELYEPDALTGADKMVVYTEVGRLEWYPASRSFGLGYVGQEYLGEAAALDPGRRLAGDIGRYFAANGGLARFGYSLSEEVPIAADDPLLPRPTREAIGQWFQTGLLVWSRDTGVLSARAGYVLARRRGLV